MAYLRERIKKLGFTSLILTLLVILMVVFGLFVVAAALPAAYASKLNTQMIAAAIGFVFMCALALCPVSHIQKKACYFLYGFSALLLILTLIAGIGTGNQSWLPIPGLNYAFQPSEFCKIALIITFAQHLQALRGQLNRPKNLLLLALHALFIIALVLLEGDLGTATVYILMIVAVCLWAGIKWYIFGGALALVAAFSPLLWNLLREYQRQRIIVVFNPSSDPAGYGYQTLASQAAIKAGGLFGVGYGNSETALSLPERHNDMIFSYLTEEFGWIGAGIVIAAFILLIALLLRCAVRAKGSAGEFVCVGMAALIAIQSASNILMCFGLLPIIGITLPFISCGGSSLISLMMGIGVSLAFSAAGRKD